MGKPRDPDYWRKWRAKHSEYRAREAERLRRRKSKGLLGKGDIIAQNVRRQVARRRASGDNGTTATEHPLIAHARDVAVGIVKPDRRTHYHDTLHDDAVSVAVLAILEGADPHEAARSFVTRERAFRWRAAYGLDSPEAEAAIHHLRAA